MPCAIVLIVILLSGMLRVVILNAIMQTVILLK
jgi:hypothetical protein